MGEVLIIELDDHDAGSTTGVISSSLEAEQFLDFLNSKMTDEDKSYGHILVTGDERGSVRIVRSYGTRVDRSEVEHLLRD